MIGSEDAPNTYAYEEYFKILPTINTWSPDMDMVKGGTKVSDDFLYTSDQNAQWMSVAELQAWLADTLAPGRSGVAPSATH
jgi:FlaA1/EpsC-like NDP-sugar epimerase